MGFLYGCDIFLFLRRIKEIDPVCLNQNPSIQNVSKKIKALLEKAFWAILFNKLTWKMTQIHEVELLKINNKLRVDEKIGDPS
jgi:hypothetical protein